MPQFALHFQSLDISISQIPQILRPEKPPLLIGAAQVYTADTRVFNTREPPQALSTLDMLTPTHRTSKCQLLGLNILPSK